MYETTPCGPPTPCTSYQPRLFVTSDGRIWREITPPRILFQFEDALFLDPSHGWVVANDCARAKAFVYRTSDGGRSWRSATVAPVNCAGGSRIDIAFADARNGWLYAFDANSNGHFGLARTIDGGAMWTFRGAPVAGAISAGAFGKVWLAHSLFAAPQQLYVTANGGRTWRRRVLPPPAGWTGAHAASDTPTFFGEKGVLPVTLIRKHRVAVAFYASNDGGHTSIATPTAWWIAAGRTHPSVAVTADAGTTWRTHPTATPLRATTWNLSATDSDHAWLMTSTVRSYDEGALYATANGGRTWERLTLPNR